MIHTDFEKGFIRAEVIGYADYIACKGEHGAREGGDLEEFLDREQERYRKQLEQYAALMRMLDNRTVKLGLYFPLLKGWWEWEWIA